MGGRTPAPRWRSLQLSRLGWSPAAAVLAALLLLALGYARAWPLELDIGGRDARFIDQVSPRQPARGFHAVERFGGRAVRWSSADATVALPRPPDGAPALLALALLNSRPDGQPDPLVRLSADGRALGGFAVPRSPGGPRVYRVLLPGGARLAWDTRLRLQVDPITLADDPRPLGVVVDRVALRPLGAPLPPSLWLLLCAAALGGLWYALPRSLGLAPGLALGAAALVAGLAALGVALRPLEVLPFVQRLAALAGLGCLGLWLARLLAPPLGEGAGARVAGADLPVYLAVAWWMGPLFQWAMTADGAANVTPAPATSLIGAALAAALAAAVAWSRWRGGRPGLTSLALAILAVAALAHLASMIQFAFTRSGPDFWILFRGAREWARGGSLYDLAAVQANHFGHVFKVPPFYGMLFTPFVFQDGLRILFFHRLLNVILLGVTALVWLRMWRIPPLSALGAGLLVVLNFRPLADTIQYGQIDLALLLALTLALWALQSGRAGLAGGLIALGTLFKLYPVLLLGFLLARRSWRGLLGFLLGMLLLNGLALAVMGWEMHRVYLLEVAPRISGTTAWVENQTIAGFLARLSAPPTDSTIFGGRAAPLLAYAAAAAGGLAALWLSLTPARPRSTAYALQYSQFLLLMVLVVPAAWMHYQTLLVVPFAALLLHLRERALSPAHAAALAASFALIAYGGPWSYYDGTVMGVLTALGVSYKFYGMLLLGGILVGELLRERAAATSGAPAEPGERPLRSTAAA